MKVFKVTFKENKAVDAKFEGYSYSSLCLVSKKDGLRQVDALNVVADNEEQSMTIANDIVVNYFGFITGPLSV